MPSADLPLATLAVLLENWESSNFRILGRPVDHLAEYLYVQFYQILY